MGSPAVLSCIEPLVSAVAARDGDGIAAGFARPPQATTVGEPWDRRHRRPNSRLNANRTHKRGYRAKIIVEAEDPLPGRYVYDEVQW
jgi:hypothetical protein